MSARASAVSVLPTPDGPTNMNTPRGLFGSSSLAVAVRTRWAIASRAGAGPMTRSTTRVPSVRTVRISSLTMRPSGTPVQAETISATTVPSTCNGTIGVSPCSSRSSACNRASSACCGESSALALPRLAAGLATATSPSLSSLDGSGSPDAASPCSICWRSTAMRPARSRSRPRRSSLLASTACASACCACSSARRSPCWSLPPAVSR
ncbi:hypothetical protein G6F58_012944 [Rhizopus delemar]|nr:hypothetical protein G6F58_012944 [Rhizopus delemar]